ncbi:CHAT domain-containing protein [Ilyonectria robusta]|uniref:CHAT domain-containing protein n=1 Tax=Ilyonectria robusta TaxID=1079257 RepID=UPI001E8E9CF6|nr:CHAT domain-containing protein [Ilyonectria robusta]KAH8648230.1 CHAT domain-containing protein [Ilyonectria robusta]
MDDLEEAIRVVRESIKVTQKDDTDRAILLSNLGISLSDKYSRTTAMADLGEAICVIREAVKITPEDDIDRAVLLSNFGGHLGDRYSRTGSMDDLEEAIYVIQEALKITPKDDLDRAGRLNSLGNRLGDRYSRTGCKDNLEEAIRVVREAIRVTTEDYPDRAILFSNLGVQLGTRHSRTGSMDDLEEAIHVAREAVKTIPEDHPDRARLLGNLGGHLGERYSRTGSLDDLEEAIRIAREAVKVAQEDHPHRAGSLSSLGVQLDNRYSHTGAMADLEEAICMSQEAVKAALEDHLGRARWLSNLANQLDHRYSRTGLMDDLEEAIRVAREAANTFPEDHPDRARLLGNLGAHLNDRYSRTRSMDDLEEAIYIVQEAVNTTPEDHPDRARLLGNLGVHLSDRYLRIRSLDDLEESIRVAREAAKITPEDHPHRAAWLNNLGVQLDHRYSRTGSMDDLEEARQSFNIALSLKKSPINVRITAGRRLLSSLNIREEGHQAYLAAKTTVELVPLLTSPSLPNTDKQYLLSQAIGLASDAAAIALHAGQGCVPAIELLETGRGVLASFLQDMRTDLASLQKKYPVLARLFVELRGQLDPPNSQGAYVTDASTPIAPGARTDQRHEAGIQMPLLLNEIRSQPGFERFLLSASEGEMREAAVQGPIVILNVSSHRCDALLVEQSGTRVLELPRLSRQDILARARDVQSLETLAWLWDAIVSPVLDALGFNKPPPGDSWPHVWWIPTGPLIRFPLHAAGHHLESSSDTALDRVVSSYSPSIKTIIHSRQQRDKETTAISSTNVVLIAMQDTPGQKLLRYASNEASAVQAVCESIGLPYVQPRPYKKEVTLALEGCRIFHFAGHGDANGENPLASLLLLKDWKQDPLTVGSLLDTNLTSKSPFLAYLSACGTSQIRHERSIDESIHLTSAFQLAGFRHVVGTLWEVDDELCVRMARLMYEFLRDRGISNESVSGGLHHATRLLRDDWLHQEVNGQKTIRDYMSVRDVEICKSTERSRPLWVPYVHYGI